MTERPQTLADRCPRLAAALASEQDQAPPVRPVYRRPAVAGYSEDVHCRRCAAARMLVCEASSGS